MKEIQRRKKMSNGAQVQWCPNQWLACKCCNMWPTGELGDPFLVASLNERKLRTPDKTKVHLHEPFLTLKEKTPVAPETFQGNFSAKGREHWTYKKTMVATTRNTGSSLLSSPKRGVSPPSRYLAIAPRLDESIPCW